MNDQLKWWRTSFSQWPLQRAHNYLLAFAISTLSVTVLLKVGDVQYLELLLAADSIILVALFIHNGLSVKVFRPFATIGFSYFVFMLMAFLLSFLVLNQNFYAYNFSFFKRPVILTLSRIIELLLSVGYMLYMASLYRKDEELCKFGAMTYYLVGVAGGIYAIVTFPLNYFLGMQLGTATVFHRMRGFNNEPGSYGTYMISVILLTFAIYQKKWLTARQFHASMALFLICLVGSQSKGAFFAAVVIAFFHMLWSRTGWRRWAFIAGVLAASCVAAVIVNIPAQVSVYLRSSATYQRLSNLHSRDPNYVQGRVSGAFIAPYMIARHPYIGIGWGNYPLVRDDPEYRRGTAFSLFNLDSPSLGPIDYIVELGFPLWLYMTCLSFLPIYFLRRQDADPWLVSLATMQPVALWFGAHLNITYQWVVVGLALGMGLNIHKQNSRPVQLS